MRPCYTSNKQYEFFAASAGETIAQQMKAYPGMTDHNLIHLLKQDYLKSAIQNLMRAYIEESVVEYYKKNEIPAPPTNYMHIENARDYLKVMLRHEFDTRYIKRGEETYEFLMAAIEQQVKTFVVDDLVERTDAIARKNPKNIKVSTISYDGGILRDDPPQLQH